MKKWPWIIGGVGAAGLLTFLVARPKKPKDYEVAEGVVDMIVPTDMGIAQEIENRTKMDPTRGASAAVSEQVESMARSSKSGMGMLALHPITPAVTVPVVRLIPKRLSPPLIPAARGGPAYSTDVGWLGPVMLFGTAVQGAYIQRMVARGHPTGWTSLSEWANTRYVRRFAPFPPPMDHHHQFRCPLTGAGQGGSVQLLPATNVLFTSHGTEVRIFRPRWGDRVVDHFEQYATQMGTRDGTKSWRDWGFTSQGAEVLKNINKSGGYDTTPFSATKGAGGRIDWGVLHYYWRARWLVWAAEMYREHYDWNGNGQRNAWRISSSGTPSSWRNYCRRWGIGIPTRWRVDNKLMFDIWANGIHPDTVMERMMEQVPPPGAIPAGTELGHGRLADWPQDHKRRYPLTQMGPQWMFFENMTNWLEYCHQKQTIGSSGAKFERVYSRVVGAVMAAVLTYMSAGAAAALAPAAGGAAGLGAGVLGTVASTALTRLLELVEGYMLTGAVVFDWRDLLLGLIGELTPAELGLGNSFDEVVAKYEDFRNGIDRVWGYGNDLMTAIEAEYLGFDYSDWLPDYN